MSIDVHDLPVAVTGRTDEEVLAAAAASPGGVDGVLDGMFGLMVERFDGEAAGGYTADVGYVITTPDGPRPYTLHIADGACTFSRTTAESPKLSTVVGLVDFLRIGAKEIEPPEAFFAGRMQLDGDLMFARKMTKWFPEDD
jgi:putative sterol carrier protein